MNPYFDNVISENEWIRTFDPSDKSEEDYVWHRDKQDREIEILSGVGWRFQFDNELPILINSKDKFNVPKMVYHRIIPGNTPLVIRIREIT